MQALFSGMLRLYAVTHRDLMNSLKQKPSEEMEGDPAQSNEEFCKQKRLNRWRFRRIPPRRHPYREAPGCNSRVRGQLKTTLLPCGRLK
jgi:hypothetical protein